MSVDIFSENLLSLAQVAKLLPPGRGGRPVHFSTVFRWIFTGVNGPNGNRVKLSAIRLGGRYLVSRESLQRFVESLMPASDESSSTVRTPTARKRDTAAAKKKLAKMGIK
jgi:hypothetical protein